MKKNNMTGILVLLVFACFMVSVLFVLLSGADIVQRLTERDQSAYNSRTAVQYLTTRVRQADLAGSIDVTVSEDTTILVLTEEIEGALYETRVYYYDGYLREMFSPAGIGLPLEFGEKILPMDDFTISIEHTYLYSLLQAELQLPDETSETVYLMLRSEGGADE